MRTGSIAEGYERALARPHAAEAAKLVWLTGETGLGYASDLSGQPPLSGIGSCEARRA